MQRNDKLQPLILRTDDSLRSAVRVVDENPEFGMAIVVDDDGKLVGILTSGDVYEAIFSGFALEAPVGDHCNRDPITLHPDDLGDHAKVREAVTYLLARKGLSFPIIDARAKIVDVLHYTVLEERLSGSVSTSPTKQRVLVIGGAGYLGTVLTRMLLEKGYRVRVLDNFTHGCLGIYNLPLQKNLEIIRDDMRDVRNIVSAMDSVRAVILLAAVVGDPASQNNPRETVEINYIAAKMIADAAKYAQINRFLFASTCSVYGTGSDILDENAALNPVSHYAKTKIAAEQAILSLYNGEFSPTIMRMGTLYGLSPRMRFDLVVNIFSLLAVRQGRIEVFGGKQWRPLLHVQDAADAFVRALDSPREKIAGQVFNVGSEAQNYQILPLAEMLREVYPNTEIVLQEGVEDARDYQVSFQKISGALGFVPSKTLKGAYADIGAYVSDHPDEDFDSPKYKNSTLDY